MMGRTPFAGVAWQVLHYVEGLRRLGCEVHYVEDTGDWPYDPERNEITAPVDMTLRRQVAGLANPASVNCTQQGGTLEIRHDAKGGAYGVCRFADGRQCEEWALFRDKKCALPAK